MNIGLVGSPNYTIGLLTAEAMIVDNDPVIFTVDYVGNGFTGGVEPQSQTKGLGETLTLAANPGAMYLQGGTFVGWNTAADGSGTPYAAGDVYSADADITLYAQWTTQTTYVVSYDGNGSAAGTVPRLKSKCRGRLSLATNSGAMSRPLLFCWLNDVADGGGRPYAVGATYSVTPPNPVCPMDCATGLCRQL